MTFAEMKQERNEWLKTLKVGDEVYVSNLDSLQNKIFGNMFKGMFGMFSGAEKDEAVIQPVCSVIKVRAVLPDGAILLETGLIINLEGQVEGTEGTLASTIGSIEIWPLNDERKDLAWRMQFSQAISKFGWDQWQLFSKDSIEKMIEIINAETLRIEEEKKAEEAAREAKKKADEEERKNQPMTFGINQHPNISNVTYTTAEATGSNDE